MESYFEDYDRWNPVGRFYSDYTCPQHMRAPIARLFQAAVFLNGHGIIIHVYTHSHQRTVVVGCAAFRTAGNSNKCRGNNITKIRKVFGLICGLHTAPGSRCPPRIPHPIYLEKHAQIIPKFDCGSEGGEER